MSQGIGVALVVAFLTAGLFLSLLVLKSLMTDDISKEYAPNTTPEDRKMVVQEQVISFRSRIINLIIAFVCFAIAIGLCFLVEG